MVVAAVEEVEAPLGLDELRGRRHTTSDGCSQECCGGLASEAHQRQEYAAGPEEDDAQDNAVAECSVIEYGIQIERPTSA